MRFSWPLPTPYLVLACNFIAIARLVKNRYTAPYSGIRRNISFDLDTYSVVLDVRCLLYLVWPHGGRQRSLPFAYVLLLAVGPVRHRTMRSGLITLYRPKNDPPHILPTVVCTGQAEILLTFTGISLRTSGNALGLCAHLSCSYKTAAVVAAEEAISVVTKGPTRIEPPQAVYLQQIQTQTIPFTQRCAGRRVGSVQNFRARIPERSQFRPSRLQYLTRGDQWRTYCTSDNFECTVL